MKNKGGKKEMKKRLSKKKIILIISIFLIIGLLPVIVAIIMDYDIAKLNQHIDSNVSSTETWNKWYKDIENEHIRASETGVRFVNNRIIILFWTTATEEQKQSAVNSVNGRVIGISDDGFQYQVEIQPIDNYDDLQMICKDLWVNNGGILGCFPENVVSADDMISSIPNDPWKDTIQGIMGTDWNEEYPKGLNWWAETIQASSAWEYNNRFSSIKIGILDNGFDTNHEDLSLTVINPNENMVDNDDVSGGKNHGTHVAGIIGATANNEKGITGIVWNKELYCADVSATKEQKDNNLSVLDIYGGIEELLKRGCKVVNMSLGGYTDDTINWGARAASYIIRWEKLLNRKDFIIVQAAGNKNNDSIHTGHFASITDESIERMFQYYDELYEKGEIDKPYRDLYSSSDIYKHFLIVGAVQQKKNGYELVTGFNFPDVFDEVGFFDWNKLGNLVDLKQYRSYTCYGEHISIVAPGKDIFSTIVSGGINGNYGYDTGTSMAAPIVTGVASLVWSVNPQFTAEEVKEIVCSNTKDVATGYDEADTRRYPIVNAKLAVEEAIKRTDNLIVGAVKDKATNNPITDVSVDVIIPGSGSTKIVASTTTNDSGEFELKLPKGTYTIVFAHDDYKRFAYNVTVDTDDITLNAPILLTPSNSIQDNEYMVNLVGITVNELASIYGSDYDVMWHWDGTRRVLYYSDKRTSCMFEIHEISESLSLNGSERIERLEYPIERRGGLGPITKELDAHMEYQDIQNVLNLELTWDELGYYLAYDYNDDIKITFFFDTKPEPTTLPSKVGILSHKLYLSSVPDTYEEDESTLNDASSFTNEPKYPTSQKYWVIFKEGFRNDRIEMSTFDTELQEGSFHIIWDGNLLLNNDDGMSRCEQFSIVNNQWNKDREYGILTDWATEIIASNVDIYDGEGNLIKAKTDYSKISMDMVQ